MNLSNMLFMFSPHFSRLFNASLIDAVSVHHCGHGQLHPAHAHLPGLHHRAKVNFSSGRESLSFCSFTVK